MSMTRRDHYRKAEELLAPISSRMEYDLAAQRDARLTTEERDILAVAQVHAALAAVPVEAGR